MKAIDSAYFVEKFGRIRDTYGLQPHSAKQVALEVYALGVHLALISGDISEVSAIDEAYQRVFGVDNFS